MLIMIKGGYYLKARCIEESEIAHAPPHVREIWDYLLRTVNYKDKKTNGIIIKRGQTMRSYSDIQEALSWKAGWRKMTYSKNDCETTMNWLKNHTMIHTEKTTRGMIITVLNYDEYQNPENYENDNETYRTHTRLIQSADTINKKEKKEKKENILSPVGDEEPKQFNFQDKIKTMFEDKDDRMKIIAYYWTIKKITFPNKETYEAGIRRELRSSGLLVGYPREQIKKTIQWLKDNSDFKWTLETVHKYIDEPLENFKTGGKPKTEEDLISEIQKKYANTQ